MITGELMPEGKPTFLQVIRYPMIKSLVDLHGKKTMLKVLFLMVKDFCNSLNVVRNMSEDQMIEAAAMLLDECDNFRLEDYVMMLQMGKKGQLTRIMDRIDISLVSEMMDEYWIRRKNAAQDFQQEGIKHLDSIGSTSRQLEQMNPQDAKMIEAADGITSAIGELKTRFSEVKNDGNEKV